MNVTRKILSFGSLNIDTVYNVHHIVNPGETITSKDVEVHNGGKGLNQSIALSRSSKNVYHAGAVGKEDGDALISTLRKANINVENIFFKDGKSGNAIIQIDEYGQNSILLYDGANRQLTLENINFVFNQFGKNDVIVLQNEINHLNEIISKAYEKDMMIFLNPSPIDEYLLKCDLDKVNWFILNEIEIAQLTGDREYNDNSIKKLSEMYPKANIVVTLGEKGSVCYYKNKIYRQKIYDVKTVDTTGAGDTFTGFFISSIIVGNSIEKSLDLASIASAICVSRKGASTSIPTMEEVLDFDSNNLGI